MMKMKFLKVIPLIILWLGAAVLTERIIVQSLENQIAKHEYAELNHIKYGLFSVNAWKEKLEVVVSDEINHFDLSKANQKNIKEQIQNQLSALIDKVYQRIAESNKRTISGRFKQSLIKTFVDIDDIKKGVPDYADTILREFTKHKNEAKLKGMLKSSVENYFDRTFEAQDLSEINVILQKRGADDIESGRKILRDLIAANGWQIYLESWLLIGLAIGIFFLAGFTQHSLSGWHVGILLMTLFLLLLAGVTTPMIDMEAKLSKLSFILLDHPVQFVDQVLYFQSKSVMDVFTIMIVNDDIQMKVVGILMVAFSIIFPILKLLSSVVYFRNFRNWKHSKLIEFFVLKSGKWSMTDVLIVAIFMAYIGFNGIITSQLSKLSLQSEDVMVLATNGTSLQPGFFIFMAYAVLALFLPGFLKKEDHSEMINP